MRLLALVLALFLAACASLSAPPAPAPLVYYGASAGHPTLDEGEGGGNPFASALIEMLAAPPPLLAFGAVLQERTFVKSNGFQIAQIPQVPPNAGDWTFAPPPAGERRVALVATISSYETAVQLPGARRDGERVAEALRKAGFDTRLVIDADEAAFRAALAEFARASAGADAALLYTTGHGLEHAGRIHLLFRDFPVVEGNAALAEHSILLTDIVAAPRARTVNLVFYAGCRDDPFTEQ